MYSLPNWMGAGLLAVMGLMGCASRTSGPDAVLQAAMTQALSACNTPIDLRQTQYLVGYGSLMQDESRKRTAPNVGAPLAVEVTGVRRGWFAKGASIGFSTTFLGAIAQESASMNAVVFSVDSTDMAAVDRRESDYCRKPVPADRIKVLGSESPSLPAGQYWVYLNSAESILLPAARAPLAQSYVDIFLSGCMELEDRFKLSGFAQRCVSSTSDWSPEWVNDRINPRRPFAAQPKAGRIDRLLNATVPELFKAIRIE